MIKPVIRLAQDSEAPIIEAILREVNLIPHGLDWSHVYPFWLVADLRGEIVGVIQVLPGKPLGHIGFWGVVPKWQSSGVGVFLLRAAQYALANSGCDGFTAVTDHPGVVKRIEGWGAVVFGPPVNWVFKRVAKLEVKKDESQSAHSN